MMVSVLRSVSRSGIMKGEGDLGVVLRWLGGVAGRQAGRQASAKCKHSR